MVTYSSEKQPALIIFWFSIEKGVFPSIQKKKKFGHRACLQLKRRICFSEKIDYTGKAAIFLMCTLVAQ